MISVSLEKLALPAGRGLQCFDAGTREAITEGLRCTVLSRASGVVFARSVAGPSGIHHFPTAQAGSLEPAPGSAAPTPLEVLIEHAGGAYLPLRLPWPPPTEVVSGARLCRVDLYSAPQRQAPPGAASVFASLVDEFALPAAWARVVVESNGLRATGMSNARGQLALHLPFPRPERTFHSPPAPPETSAPHAMAALTLFYDEAVSIEANEAARVLPGRASVPRRAEFLSQPQVAAQAAVAGSGELTSIRLDMGQPCVLRTVGRSDLRLLPV